MDAASVPIKLSAISKNIETDENDQSNQEMVADYKHNPEKSTPKNYMCTTISADSKIVLPGKKILAERNEVSDLICSDTHVQKTMNPEPKITSFSIMNHDDKINALVVEDSSLMPYDPLTNYLTPRPKFLRYKPNRRRDIFLTQKNGVGEREDALTVSRRGSFNSENCTEKEGDSVDGHGMQGFSSSQESELEQEDEEVWGSDVEDEEFEESDEEFEESDEEDGEFEDNDEENEELEKGSSWNVKRALKFLLLCFILVLSTAYISSMNSQAPSPISQCFEVARHGYWMIQNHTDDSTAWKHEGGIGTRQQTGVLEVNQKAAEEGTKVEEMVQAASESKIETGGDFLDQKEETQKGIIEWVREEIVVEDATGEIIEITDKLFEDLEQEGGGNEDVEMVDNQEKEPVDGMFEVLELQRGETEDVCDSGNVKNGETSGQMVQESQLQDAEIVETLAAPKGIEVFSMDDGDEAAESKSEAVASVTNKEGEIETSERIDNKDEYFETQSLVTEENFEEGPLEHLRRELITKAVIGVSTVIGSLILGFLLKHKSSARKDSCLSENPSLEPSILQQEKSMGKNSPLIVVEPYSENVITGKCSSTSPSERDGKSKRIVSFMGPSLSRDSVETEGCRGSQGPTVELLGEFVIGEVSSSLRISGVKKRNIEREDSNFSVSLVKSPGIKSQSVPVDPQPAFSSQLSTMDSPSPSYGSFKSERKIMKKEEGKGEEKITTTPVRRSSRIRNRAVKSP